MDTTSSVELVEGGRLFKERGERHPSPCSPEKRLHFPGVPLWWATPPTLVLLPPGCEYSSVQLPGPTPSEAWSLRVTEAECVAVLEALEWAQAEWGHWLGLTQQDVTDPDLFLPMGVGAERGLLPRQQAQAPKPARNPSRGGSCEWGGGQDEESCWGNERGFFQDTCCRVLVSCPA